MAHSVYRHEYKYLISKAEMIDMQIRMRPYFKLDPHAGENGYIIRSIYFDDYWNSAYEEKDMGVFNRKKYRIRFYDFNDEVIHVERKKKAGAYIYKESAPITHEELDKILNGDYEFLLKKDNNLLREFYYECITNVLRPRVIVDYDRVPYIMDYGTVRITFDEKVRAASVYGDNVFDKDGMSMEVLEPNKLILEVKYTEFLPRIVQDMIPGGAKEFTAASKYVMCCDKLMYLHDYGYWYENGEKEW